MTPPDSWVKTATIFLRKKLFNIPYECDDICRENKQCFCTQITEENYQFTELEALLRIIYQIRCNLFHGDKLEYSGFQEIRNRELVNLSNQIIKIILNRIIFGFESGEDNPLPHPKFL